MPTLPPRKLVVTLTENATHLIAEATVSAVAMGPTILEKSDPNFDAKLGQALRIYSRTNYDSDYSPS